MLGSQEAQPMERLTAEDRLMLPTVARIRQLRTCSAAGWAASCIRLLIDPKGESQARADS
jgi:hypothetical protein